MAGIRQTPETTFRFRDPSLVLKQVKMVANDGLFRVQSLGDSGGVNNTVRVRRKVSACE